MVRRSLNVSFAALLVMLLPLGLAFTQGGGATGVGNPGSGTAPSSSPPITGQSSPAAAPVTVQDVAEQPASSSTGLAKPSADGTSTIIVPARPCSTAAHETDGTTTCVGIPGKR
jgi:hypothetical protein